MYLYKRNFPLKITVINVCGIIIDFIVHLNHKIFYNMCIIIIIIIILNTRL